jgi:methylmalonyl-CoA mutase cobalamin-binding domain/chain
MSCLQANVDIQSRGGKEMSKDMNDALRAAILDGDDVQAARIAQEIANEPSAVEDAVKTAIQAIRHVGDLFGEGEIFLPEMMLAAEAMQAFMKIAGPELEKSTGQVRTSGKVVLGTVKGDIHTIGKDIVATMLSASGFEVNDMGVDVAPMDMIETAEKSGAQIIGLSALMTTSMPYQKEVIDLMNELNMRDAFWVIVGGGPLTAEYAASIGANGWARNAAGAVRLCERLLTCRGELSSADFVAEEK